MDSAPSAPSVSPLRADPPPPLHGGGQDLTCRIYELGDLAALRPRADMRAEIEALGRDAHDKAIVGWTLLDGETVLACAWLEFLSSRHYSLAACVSDMTSRQWAQAAMFVRQKLTHFDAALDGTISAACRADLPKACAFLVRFGFAIDITAPAAADGYLTLVRRSG